VTDYVDLPCRDDEGNLNFVVESPRGSGVKWKYDPKRSAFVFQRALLLGVSYPYDWGFIAGTRAPDGDPVDAMLMFEFPSWPGVVVPSKPIGVVRMTQVEPGAGKERNDRLIILPVADLRYRDVKDLPERVKQELERFFVTTSEMTGKKVSIEGWAGSEAAEEIIERSRR